MEKVVDFVDNLKLGISSVVFCKILKLKVMTEMRCHGLVFELPEKRWFDVLSDFNDFS
jgi:hypothetical protein